MSHNAKLKKELVRFTQLCEEVLVAATQDLAVLVNHQVKASKIVSLSLKIESIQQLAEATPPENVGKLSRLRSLSEELLSGVKWICQIAQQVARKAATLRDYSQFWRYLTHWPERLHALWFKADR